MHIHVHVYCVAMIAHMMIYMYAYIYILFRLYKLLVHEGLYTCVMYNMSFFIQVPESTYIPPRESELVKNNKDTLKLRAEVIED